MKTLLIIVLCAIATPSFAKCKIIDCTGYQYKVCGKKRYARDYSCENGVAEKAIKEFREKGSVEGVGYGLKYYIEDKHKEIPCPEKWRELKKNEEMYLGNNSCEEV